MYIYVSLCTCICSAQAVILRQWDSMTVGQCDSKTVGQYDSGTLRQCDSKTVGQ